jgi:hypothetical protein
MTSLPLTHSPHLTSPLHPTHVLLTTASQGGESKEGAGRVALFRETGLTHLYTVESNYNVARTGSNVVPPCSGDHGGCVSPPSGKRPPPRLTTDMLQVSQCVCTRGKGGQEGERGGRGRETGG